MKFEIFVGFACKIGGEADKDKKFAARKSFFALGLYLVAFGVVVDGNFGSV